MIIILDDKNLHLEFAPLSLTRPIGELRIGIMTNAERWKFLIPESQIHFATEEYLSEKYTSSDEGVLVRADIIPTRLLADAVTGLNRNESLVSEIGWIAKNGKEEKKINYNEPLIQLNERWDLYRKNDEAIRLDYNLKTEGRVSQQLSSTNTVIGDSSQIFLEAGARVEGCILNAETGPIYIGNDAEIMEGSLIRGPLAMNENSTLKLGSKIYGATTVGPHCKVGGEVNNCIFQGYSNKGHDGFLGNSIVGEWCNIGADTNTSNLKNNYGKVKAYDFRMKKMVQTDVQFMGLMMGDHSKCGINTMFNTASVVGVFCNVFGADFPPKYIPSFTWGSEGDEFQFEKAIESANNMMSRRSTALNDDDIRILRHISDNK